MKRMISLIFSLPVHKDVHILLILSEDVNLSLQLALPQFFLLFANGLGKSFSKAS
jgi:hypothetical protein